MKVKELIEKLSQMDPEATVRFTYDYGDHCHTEVAQEITRLSNERVRYNEYVGDFALTRNVLEDGGEDYDEEECAVVLA
jgi:hypothetical protein